MPTNDPDHESKCTLGTYRDHRSISQFPVDLHRDYLLDVAIYSHVQGIRQPVYTITSNVAEVYMDT